ncbi:hypothetical protein [Limibacillus halophilus]
MTANAFSLAFSPLLPLALLIALALVALAASLLAVLSGARGGWLRLLFALIVLGALANPSLVTEEREALPNVVLLMLDESGSQAIANRPAQIAEVQGYLQARFDGIENLEVRRVPFGEEGQLRREGTNLTTPLRRALAEIPAGQLAAVLLVSDGRIHDLSGSPEALGVEAPLHLLLTGRPGEADRRLTVTQAPAYGLIGKPLSLTVRVDDLGGAPPAAGLDGQARLFLRQPGKPDQTLLVPIGRETEIGFELDRRGRSVLDLEVEQGPDELTLINNRAAIEVQGVRERLRVLLVSGEPHSGERAWRNLLKSDPSIDLVHFTILRPPEKQDGTPIRELSLIAFPTRELFEVKLDEFDLIIFDRYRRRGVLPQLYLGNVARYISQGGALLEAAGPAFASPLSLYRTPLGAVLPGEPSGRVLEGAYKAKVTELGQRHPVTAGLDGGLSEPPWGRWYRQVDIDARRGSVLMTGYENKPLLLLDRVGEGRVAQLASDHIWLWARGYDGGGPQAELTRRVAHWLMKEPELEEEDLRAEINGEEMQIERRSLSPSRREVTVTQPDGEEVSFVMEPDEQGRMRASLPVSQIGLYRISDGEKTALATAGALNPLEYQDLRSSAEALTPWVEASGGGIARLSEPSWPELRMVKPGRDSAGRGWLGLHDRGAYRVTGVKRTSLLPGLALLLLTLGALSFAWTREGR